ncbi:hypothetical protein BDD12DRAFT_424689 [Trichophaea hybrida]|nr:hypothetical protein BDD12DRAFT_424689 [Trichophaea hybrida]
MSATDAPSCSKGIITIPDTDQSDSELSELEGYDTDPELDDGAQSDDEENQEEDGDAWDSESLLEDALDELKTEVFDPEDDPVTPEEQKQLKTLLKMVGEGEFIHQVIIEGGMTIRKCLTAFNVRPVCTFLTPSASAQESRGGTSR